MWEYQNKNVNARNQNVSVKPLRKTWSKQTSDVLLYNDKINLLAGFWRDFEDSEFRVSSLLCFCFQNLEQKLKNDVKTTS